MIDLFTRGLLRAARPHLERTATGGPGVLVFGYRRALVDFLAGYDREGEHWVSRTHVIAIIDHEPKRLVAASVRARTFYEPHVQTYVIDQHRVQSAADMAEWVNAWRTGVIFVNEPYALDFASMLEQGAIIRRPAYAWQPPQVTVKGASARALSRPGASA